MTTQQKLIKSKLNLLELGSYLGNASEVYPTSESKHLVPSP